MRIRGQRVLTILVRSDQGRSGFPAFVCKPEDRGRLIKHAGFGDRHYFFSDFRFWNRERVERVAISCRRWPSTWAARPALSAGIAVFFDFLGGRCGMWPRSQNAAGLASEELRAGCERLSSFSAGVSGGGRWLHRARGDWPPRPRSIAPKHRHQAFLPAAARCRAREFSGP